MYGTNARVTQTGQPALVRAIGRWSLAALVVNSIIGSAVFGLPSVFAGLVGRTSPLAVLVAGAATAIFVACYAEVASQAGPIFTSGRLSDVLRAFKWPGSICSLV